MGIPRTDLPILCFMHPSVLRGMALTCTVSRKVPDTHFVKREKLLEDIRLGVAEVRRRIDLMDLDDEEIEKMVKRAGRTKGG